MTTFILIWTTHDVSDLFLHLVLQLLVIRAWQTFLAQKYIIIIIISDDLEEVIIIQDIVTGAGNEGTIEENQEEHSSTEDKLLIEKVSCG